MKLFSSIAILSLLSLCYSCSKSSSTGSPPVIVKTNICGVTGLVQDTVTDNGGKFCIVAGMSKGSGTLLIELVQSSGTGSGSYSADFVQASNGSNCYQANLVKTYLAPSQMPAYDFGPYPAWANDTNTVCVAKITINSHVYYMRDRKLNK
jgi:hypothetical protein